MIKLLQILNENHWYLIAGVIACGFVLWLYGCQSTVTSLLHPQQRINRAQLELEVDYIMGQAEIKLTDLNQQDQIKYLLLDQAAIFGSTGTFNPMGLLNTFISIGAIAFGLDRNKRLKDERKNHTS